MTRKPSMSAAEARKVRQCSRLLFTSRQIDTSLDKLAGQLHEKVSDKDPLFISVMHGGLIPVAQLITRLDFPLELDYVHATRYGNRTSGKEELNWLVRPAHNLTDRNLVIIDDIYDEGHTMVAVVTEIKKLKPASLMSVVLFNKQHNRKSNFTPDLVGMDIPDIYIFGNGMDYRGYFRNLTDIYALHSKDLDR